jgi:hypothetical protein
MYYLRNTICIFVRLELLDRLLQYLEIIVSNFTQMGLERCSLRVTVNIRDYYYVAVERTKHDVLYVTAVAACITRMCCEKNIVVGWLWRSNRDSNTWRVAQPKTLAEPSQDMISFTFVHDEHVTRVHDLSHFGPLMADPLDQCELKQCADAQYWHLNAQRLIDRVRTTGSAVTMNRARGRLLS